MNHGVQDSATCTRHHHPFRSTWNKQMMINFIFLLSIFMYCY